MKKVLFIDRDGTLIREPEDEQIDSFEKLEFYPEVFKYLGKITAELDYELVMVTNQDGLGSAVYPEDSFWPVHNFIMACCSNEGIDFEAVHIDRTFPSDNADTRKPETGLLTSYFSDEYDLENSFVIGDRLTDMELAKNLGSGGIYINNETFLGSTEITVKENELHEHIALETSGWKEIYHFLKLQARTASVNRNTKETKITVKLNLDGTGKSEISTGIAFFDHMLDQLARHGQLDLKVDVVGDLDVDEHHTIEDTAIALGEAFKTALADKIGIERYGYCLPMDDCMAQ
ncbi:MAG: histidinol-phosphatase, partial [Bacteroidia bacterium]|nr:histidinol-phosphatase [Bacteroidia bacterium]